MSTKASIGRAISIVGHPFLVTPLAVGIATAGISPRGRLVILGLLVAAMAAVAVHVVRRHRRGEVTDIDVSTREQRGGVFRVAIGSLVATMAVLWATGSNPAALRGAAVATGLFVACAIVNQRLKASLHCAFGMLAAGVVFPANRIAGVGFAVFAVVVGWGRVAYGRHTVTEVIVGLGLGAVAAATLVAWIAQLR